MNCTRATLLLLDFISVTLVSWLHPFRGKRWRSRGARAPRDTRARARPQFCRAFTRAMLNADDRDRLAPDASPLEKPATENNNDLDETLSWDLVSVSELSSRAASPGAALSIRSASSSMDDIIAIAAARATMTTVRPSRPHPPPLANPVTQPSHPSPSDPKTITSASTSTFHQSRSGRRARRARRIDATPPHAPRAARVGRPRPPRAAPPSDVSFAANPDTPGRTSTPDNLLDGLRVALERARTTVSTRGRNLIRAFVGECAGAKTRAASTAKAAVRALGYEGGGYLGVIVVAFAAAAAFAGWAFARGDASGRGPQPRAGRVRGSESRARDVVTTEKGGLSEVSHR